MSFGDETFEYDGMGNPTTYRDMECKWEKGRQLAKVDDGTNTVTFTYDVFGVRTSKNVNGTTTHYVYENGKLLRQTTGNDTIDFIYGRDGVIGFTLNNVPYLYRKNLFGDVVEIYDQSGNAVGKYSYTAFGECSIELDTDSIATKNPIRYRGYYYDKELKLYYLKSRYYDPEVGRFITIDDLSYLDPENINGLNLYAYCGNNPVMCVDPDGTAKWWQWLLFGIGAALVVAAAVVLTVMTGGAAAGLIGAIAVGAAKGALIGAAVGAAVGIAGGAIYSAVTGADMGESILSGFLMGFGIGAVVGAIIGGVAGGFNYTHSGLSRGAVNKAVNSTLKDANKMNHIMQPKHNLPKSIKEVGKLMKKTLIKGDIMPYKSVSSAFWAVANSQVTFMIVDGLIRISDMWVI